MAFCVDSFDQALESIRPGARKPRSDSPGDAGHGRRVLQSIVPDVFVHGALVENPPSPRRRTAGPSRS
jgi:hypothetical protein